MAKPVSLGEVLHTAEIARIKLSEAEARELECELNQILGEFSKIGEVRESGAEIHYIHKPVAKVRKDAVKKTDAAPIVSQFAKSEDGFMSAPKSL